MYIGYMFLSKRMFDCFNIFEPECIFNVNMVLFHHSLENLSLKVRMTVFNCPCT